MDRPARRDSGRKMSPGPHTFTSRSPAPVRLRQQVEHGRETLRRVVKMTKAATTAYRSGSDHGWSSSISAGIAAVRRSAQASTTENRTHSSSFSSVNKSARLQSAHASQRTGGRRPQHWHRGHGARHGVCRSRRIASLPRVYDELTKIGVRVRGMGQQQIKSGRRRFVQHFDGKFW